MSELTTILDAIKAAGAPRAYEPNKVPPTPTYPYIVGFLSTVKGAQTNDGKSHQGRRFAGQAFSKTSDGIEALQKALNDALNGQALPLPGDPVVEFEMSSQLDRDADDNGVLNITYTYRY